jgi:hypothetical protein
MTPLPGKGTVLGTPQSMAPEQAMLDLDGLEPAWYRLPVGELHEQGAYQWVIFGFPLDTHLVRRRTGVRDGGAVCGLP